MENIYKEENHKKTWIVKTCCNLHLTNIINNDVSVFSLHNFHDILDCLFKLRDIIVVTERSREQ